MQLCWLSQPSSPAPPAHRRPHHCRAVTCRCHTAPRQQRTQPPHHQLPPPPPRPTADELFGMDAGELSVTADLIRHSFDGVNEPLGTLAREPWVQELLAADASSRVVFSAHGQGSSSHHLSTGLGGDHLFLSLMQGGLIADMLVVYQGDAGSSQIRSAIRFGLPVCGHPTIVHGGLTSAVLDETFGTLIYSAGRWGHLDVGRVFTARLEVDYKKPLPAESTILCSARIEQLEGRKIWVAATVTDASQQLVYASSRALFIKAREPAAEAPAAATAAAAAAAAGHGDGADGGQRAQPAQQQ